MGTQQHCWEDGPDRESSCILVRHHPGDHDFTPDDEIKLTFLGNPVVRRKGA